jgi:SAM-dependent methyltransferase
VTALDFWRDQLAAWAIPEPVLAGAVDSPWVLPRVVFQRRVDRRMANPLDPSYREALAGLPVPGSVLDVGAGAGAASLPLRERLTAVTAVDTDAQLLEAFAARAAEFGIPYLVLCGRWPDVAGDVEPADVVVCGHVLYNVADLGPFVLALSAHARRKVVVELTQRHPLTALNPLWQRFHGLSRPEGPTAADAVAALEEVGVHPRVIHWSRPAQAEYATVDELVEVTRRRLCLPAEASAEVRRALYDLGVSPSCPPDLGSSGRQLVTLSWEPERTAPVNRPQ